MIKTGKMGMLKALSERELVQRFKPIFLASIIIFIFIFNFSFISAVPPITQVQQFPDGYTLIDTQNKLLTQNQDYLFSTFVYNSSNGKILGNATIDYCRFFLANAQGYNLFAGNMTYQDWGGWSIEILGGNFSEIGYYNYGANCENNLGGTIHGVFEVNPNGSESFEFSGPILIIIFLLLGVVLFITYLYNRQEYYLPLITGIIFLFTGIFSFTALEGIFEEIIKNVIAMIIIGLGLFSLSESIWRFFPDD